MRINKLQALFVIALLMGTFSLKAQVSANFTPKIFPKSPNSAALGKFGDYPVSMFSGVPNISIPLYEIQAGGLSLPITLDYHASGLKVAETPSWAGLGWAVNSGGQITRRIAGKPDEGTSGYLTGSVRQVSSFSTPLTDNDLIYLDQVRNGEKDSQPDIFSYSFPGKSGKFFFNGTKPGYPIQLVPFAPVKVTRTSAQFLTGFNILDEHGNAFQFGTIETTDPHPNNSSNPQTSAWMLDRIISQNRRDTIGFSYTNDNITTSSGSVESFTVSDLSYNYGSQVYVNNPGTGSVSTSNVSILEQKTNTITFKNGKVVFVQSAANRLDLAAKSLDNIQVYNLDYATHGYSLLKTIRFYQSYFTDGTSQYPARLRLDSIGIFDKNGLRIQRYAFNYNTTVLLPAFDSKGQDYWGYYNGKDGQSSLIPYQTPDYSNVNGGSTTIVIGGAQGGRESDGDKMQACILQRIYLPTGGYTDFQYQPNQYYESGALKLAGGLRISNIKSYDGINAIPIVKSYQYSDARRNFQSTDYAFFTTVTGRYWDTRESGGAAIYGTQRRRTFTSSANADLESWDGILVTYPTVTEYTNNGSANLGKTVYRYTDYPDAQAFASYSGKKYFDSFFFNRGQLQSKSVYAAGPAGTYKIVQREQMGYTAFALASYNGVGIAVGKQYINEGVKGPDGLITGAGTSGNDLNAYMFAATEIFSDDNYLTSKTTTTYSADTTQYVTSTEQYKFDNFVHQQPTRVYHTDSRGNTIISTSKYPADYLGGGTSTGNLLLDSMLNRNMQAEQIEKWDTLKYTSPVSSVVKSGQLSTFKFASSGAIVPEQIKTLNVITPLTNFVASKINLNQLVSDSRYEQAISFDSYDGKNNLTQYTPRNSGPSSVIWDYGNDLPVADIKNALLTTVAFTGFEGDGKGKWTFSGTPVVNATAPAGAKVYNLSSGAISATGLPAGKNYLVSYWSNAGPATVTSPGTAASSAIRSYNGWTLYQHKLPATATSVTVAGSVTIDELRLYPADAQMTTYAYQPLVGPTSVTDTRGQTSIYEYDAFQRLMNIRDQNNNIVKNYTYNYPAGPLSTAAPVQLYYNQPRAPSIQKNDCGPNAVGSFVTFPIPGQMFSSTISPADAEQQATNYANTTGQAYANANGSCTGHIGNELKSQPFTKNNCGVGFTGSTYTYVVPANTYFAATQTAANQLAQDDINTKGQLAANGPGGGTCPGGTDVANWSIGYSIYGSGGHTVSITVSRPAGDINNINRVNYRIHMISGPDQTGYFDMPSGVNGYTTNATFSVTMTGNVVSIAIDSIN